MIVNVKRKELLMQAKKVACAAPNSVAVEELKGILLEADNGASVVRMTTTNFEVAIRSILPASVEKSGSVIIDTKLLIGILTVLHDDDVYMELLENGRLYIKNGNTQYEISVLAGKNYPKVEIPFPGDTITIKGLKNLIRQSIFSVDKSGAHSSIYSCVNLIISESGAWAVATDCSGCVVQVKGDPECKGNISLLIPHTTLSLLASMSDDKDVYELGVTGNMGVCKNVVLSDGSVLFSAKLMDGKFLDTNKVFSSVVPKSRAYVMAENIYQMLDNISSFASSNDRVEIAFGNDELLLRFENDNGGFSGCVDAKGIVSNTEKYYYFPKKLTQCFRGMKGQAIMNFGADGNIIIQNDSARYFISRTRPAEPQKTGKGKNTKKEGPQTTNAAA